MIGDMSQSTTHSKDYQNSLHSIVENEISTINPNNEILWKTMGDELEIEGVPKEQISTIVRKDIEDKIWEQQFKEECSREGYRYRNSRYYQFMKNNGWTNPEMARNTGNLDPQTDQKIVPHNNPEMKAVCYDIINLCRIMIDKSKDGISFEDVFSEKTMSEFYKQQHTLINNCKNAIDNKTKVPKNTEVFLLECLATITKSVNKCAEIFMEENLKRLKSQCTISIRTGKPVPFFTLKQATKYQKGMRQSQQFILKPPTRDMALFLDYTGIQCKCGSYRVRQKQESYKLECYDCDGVMPQGHISKCNGCKVPLYKERLLHIVKTGKCENCNEIVDLPQELIDYAKS